MHCAQIVHGATRSNNTPALDGLWSTLVSNCTSKQLQNYIENSESVMTNSVAPAIKTEVNKFESSNDNVTRSVKVLYKGGLISKDKYKEIRLSSLLHKKGGKQRKKIEFMKGVPHNIAL